MNDPLSVADEQQLSEWAFGRQGVVTDRELAEAALRELARRAAVAKAEAEAQAEAELEASRAASAPTPAPPRIRVTRRVILLAAATVLAAVVATLLVVIAMQPTSSLAVFDREPTAAELDLSIVVPQELLAAEVEGGTLAAEVEVRILAESPTVTVLAFRTDSLSSDPSGTVCVAVVESAVASDAICTSLDSFAVDGITTILRSYTGIVAINWGPHGEAEIRLPDDFDVGPSGG